ncbi:MAG: efflux RND transporter periplasmic adaptor subunit [Saprospiraceae bacterium]
MRPIQVLLFFFVLSIYSCKTEETKDPKTVSGPKEQKATKVEGIIAKEEITSSEIRTTGSTMANEEVEIKSEISGKITSIGFKEGAYITKGQLLVKLNDDDMQAQMKKWNVELKLADEKEARQKQLLAANAISKEEYDLALSNSNLIKANMEILRTQIDKTKIVAPFSGIIGLKYVSPGAFITSSTVIANIQNVQPLKLEFSIPEKYNYLIQPGSPVKFSLSGSASYLNATVYAKEPKIDEVTRTAKIRATFANASGKLMPGSFADIIIPIGAKEKVKMVPTIAYIPDISGAKLYLCKDGKVKSVTVKAGIRTESQIQILEGIEEGDTVLTSGILQLKPNMPIEVNITNQAQ